MQYSLDAFIISLIPAIAWGIMAYLITKVTRKLEVFQTQFLFQLIGIPFMLLVLPFLQPVTTIPNPLLIIALGVFEAFVFTLFFYALKIGNLTIINPIIESYVLVTILLAVLFLHEVLFGFKIFGIFAVFVGIVLLGLQLHEMKQHKQISLHKGVLQAVIAAIGTGIYFFGVSISSKINGWFVTSIGIRISIVITILIYFLLKQKVIKKIFMNVPWKILIPASILDVIAFLMFSFALTKYEVSYVTVMGAVSPVVTTFLGIFLLKERMHFYQIIGFILVLVGIVCINIK